MRRAVPQPSTDATDGRRDDTATSAAAAALAASLARNGVSTPAIVLWLLFAINAVNYLDRLLVVAVGPTLKADFHLTDREIGLLSSAFLILYTLATLPLGLLADRVARARVLAVGVALWSLMSAATAFVQTLPGLVVTRAAVGIGEASYYPAGTALLSAYYPLERRARAISRWGAGQLVGTALAFVLSAALYTLLGPHLAWRLAFLLSGIPGLALAITIWFVRDTPPSAGATVATREPQAQPLQPMRASQTGVVADAAQRVRAVLAIPTVRVGIVLQAVIYIAVTPAVTFLPIYLQSSAVAFRLTLAQSSLLDGALLIVGGLLGVLLGGYLSDWLGRRVRGGRIVAVGVACAIALPCYATMLLARSLPLFAVSGLLAVLALNLQVGPLGAAVQDATPPALRSTAVAVGLLLAHLLGDAWAPTAVGTLSTTLGEQTGIALLLVGGPALVVGVIVAALGARAYAADLDRRAREAMAQ